MEKERSPFDLVPLVTAWRDELTQAERDLIIAAIRQDERDEIATDLRAQMECYPSIAEELEAIAKRIERGVRR